MRFIHCSDIHLGNSIRGNQERYLDYFRAFRYVAEKAVELKVDCLVIAGDLFEQGSIKPTTLVDTVEVLEILKDHNIPVVAIEGNHDRFQRRRDESWLLYLSKRGYLHLLRPEKDFVTGEVTFPSYDAEKGWGGWIEIAGKTMYGLGCWGHGVATELTRAAKNFTQKYDIALLHAGVWDQGLIDIARISKKEFQPLGQFFRYVALGHGHLKYEIADEEGNVFGYNPGALEAVNREESLKREKGLAYLVDLEEDNFQVTSLDVPRRSFLNLQVDVDNASNPDEVLERLRAFLDAYTRKNPVYDRPVLFIEIFGKVNFNTYELDLRLCEATAESVVDSIITVVENRTSLVTHTGKYAHTSTHIDDIFQQTISDLVKTNGQYAQKPDAVIDLVYRFQEMISGTSKTDCSDLVDALHYERLRIDKEDSADVSHE